MKRLEFEMNKRNWEIGNICTNGEICKFRTYFNHISNQTNIGGVILASHCIFENTLIIILFSF